MQLLTDLFSQDPKRRWSLSNMFKGKSKLDRQSSVSSVSDDEFGFGGEFGVFKPPPPRRNSDAHVNRGHPVPDRVSFSSFFILLCLNHRAPASQP
jgi:hypothetical protein